MVTLLFLIDFNALVTIVHYIYIHAKWPNHSQLEWTYYCLVVAYLFACDFDWDLFESPVLGEGEWTWLAGQRMGPAAPYPAAMMGITGLHHSLCTGGETGVICRGYLQLCLYSPPLVYSGSTRPYICSPYPSFWLDQLYCLVEHFVYFFCLISFVLGPPFVWHSFLLYLIWN